MANTFDIYIQTSLWEGLPITILEAMALGKVVIATNVIGNKDAVVNGETGYLCNTAFEFKEKF
ncbi:glycosyltransferase [Seonamhaeicola sp. S2-3]|uniref:glycosyltransferase n=1 Tax=Seonamhaeicola sp. S2-3 TaxID=1936081 RepID=UPI0009FA982B